MPIARIICTLGPASGNISILKKMSAAGMDIVRANCSHADLKQLLVYIDLIRKLNKNKSKKIKILLDLEGPRIRIGKLNNHKPVEIKRGQIIWLTNKNTEGKDYLIPFDYEGPISSIKGAKYIYIDDGLISLKIKAMTKDKIKTESMCAGAIKEFKGINIPGAKLRFAGLSTKDRDDIHFGIEHKVDFIAQSFVRNAEDILEVRRIVEKKFPSCKLISKIENQEGINNIEEIIDASDGIMVARGDMGVSIPIYKVPIVQKNIIKRCNRMKKFVITATQMLESMTENIRPTRAEVTDVANAVLDGTDYVMLSGETSIGKYPAETVKMMDDIIKYTEKIEFAI